MFGWRKRIGYVEALIRQVQATPEGVVARLREWRAVPKPR